MTPTEVLKMLERKINQASLSDCSYVIETSDIKAICEALRAICPECDNPYPHLRSDGSGWCEDCGHEWEG